MFLITRSRLRRCLAGVVYLLAMVVVLLASRLGHAAGDSDLYPKIHTGKAAAIDWLQTIRKRIPRMKHDRGSRWPIILSNGVGFGSLSTGEVRSLLARGITQHIPLEETAIGTARALQLAGSPVIIMESKTGVWPYNLIKDKQAWAHQYSEDLKIPRKWRDLPVPTRFAGWSVAGERIRSILRRFKEARIKVDAVWLDYEGEPSQADYYAAVLSPTTRAALPRAATINEAAFNRFRRQLWVQLVSTYMAAPVREIYPDVSVTNWVATLSTPERPVMGWLGRPHPFLGPTLFTATTPVAYAVDSTFLASWRQSYTLDRTHVDRFFMNVMLRQVSADAYNRKHMAPYLNAIAWVARWVPDNIQRKVPVMSRGHYRESLRHLWLRGIDAMQVYNPVYGANREMAISEVQDVALVYDEMMAYRKFLDDGEVMNFEDSTIQADAVLWSGLRLGEEAVLRVIVQGSVDGSVTLEPWPGLRVALPATRQGATLLLRRDRKNNKVTIVPNQR